ncbi:MAG: DUF1743 domain-containing protein, partial [Thermoplasmata archaeon]
MCTTFLASCILFRLASAGYTLANYPALVRLNPNIPYRTRGNAALCFEILPKKNRIKKTVGDSIVPGRQYRPFINSDKKTFYLMPQDKRKTNISDNNSQSELSYQEREDIINMIRKEVELFSRFECSNTNPGTVLLWHAQQMEGDISKRRDIDNFLLFDKFYKRCVKTEVKLDDALQVLSAFSSGLSLKKEELERPLQPHPGCDLLRTKEVQQMLPLLPNTHSTASTGERIPVSVWEGDGCKAIGYKNSRGIIGALAAISWACTLNNRSRIMGSVRRSGNFRKLYTFELIGYRLPFSISSDAILAFPPRLIEKETVLKMEKRLPWTFNNIDLKNNHIAITPNTPCPVLYGVRGTRAQLWQVPEILGPSKPEGWTIFISNQATDDHLIAFAEIYCDCISSSPASSPSTSSPSTSFIHTPEPPSWKNTSAYLHAIIEGKPEVIKGGHVFVKAKVGGISCPEPYNTISLTLAAYEPSKEFAEKVRTLVPGDEIAACGTFRCESSVETDEPYPLNLTLNLEKFFLLKKAELRIKKANPLCFVCNKRMKSKGKSCPFRCTVCGRRAPRECAEYEILKRPLEEKKWYEPPVCARRHLYRPVELG